MAKDKDLFNSFISDLGDDYTAIAAQGLSSAESTGFLDTGSYVLNAAFSGSIYGGMHNNKVLVFAGETTTGKTFFTLGLVATFLAINPTGRVFYFDTESAVTNKMLTERGIDLTRVAKSEPENLQKFKQICLKILEKYGELPVDERFPLLIVLDSLSMLPSEKEVQDTREEKSVRDMTTPREIKSIYRIIRLKLAKLKVPHIVTNHTYEVIGAYVPTKKVAGGSGLQYATDTIAMLTKSKERDGDKKVVGNIVTVTMVKSRLTKENTKVQVRILFDGGLDRFYGLLELAERAGIFSKVGNKYKLPDGTSAFEKAIHKNPAKYFTKDVLDQLDAYVAKEFLYTNEDTTDEELGDDEDE